MLRKHCIALDLFAGRVSYKGWLLAGFSHLLSTHCLTNSWILVHSQQLAVPVQWGWTRLFCVKDEIKPKIVSVAAVFFYSWQLQAANQRSQLLCATHPFPPIHTQLQAFCSPSFNELLILKRSHSSRTLFIFLCSGATPCAYLQSFPC